MLLAIEGRLRRDTRDAGYDAAALRFTLLSADPDILITYPSRVRRRLREILSARGITVIPGAAATGVDGGVVQLEGGETLTFDEILLGDRTVACALARRYGPEARRSRFRRSRRHPAKHVAPWRFRCRRRSLASRLLFAQGGRPRRASRPYPLREPAPRRFRRAAPTLQAAEPNPFADFNRRTLRRRHAQRPDVRRRLGLAMQRLARPAIHGQVQEFVSWRFGSVTRV